MTVLKKDVADPGVLERRGAVGLREESAMIPMPSRRDSDDIRDYERLEMKGHGTVYWMSR
jgi:hypothetical protein